MRHPATEFLALNPDVSLSAGHDRMIVFARRKSGALAHIDDVENGKACDCNCLACNEPLVARQGDIRGHSFAHESGAQCSHALEATLYAVTEALIADRKRLLTPELRIEASVPGPSGRIVDCRVLKPALVPVDSVALEVRAPWRRKMVRVVVKGRELLIRIAVRRSATEQKRAEFAAAGVAAIELDVSRDLPATVAAMADLLFTDDKRKRWLHNPRGMALRAELEASLGKVAEERWERYFEDARAQREQRRLAAAEAAQREVDRRLAEEGLVRRRKALAERFGRFAERMGSRNLRPMVEYGTPEGLLWLLQGGGAEVRFMAEPGVVAMVAVLKEMGAVEDTEVGGYRISREGWARAMSRLSRLGISARSLGGDDAKRYR